MKEETKTIEKRRFSLFSKTLSRSLESIVKPISKKHGFAEHRILSEWESVVGKELARSCQPQKLSFPRGEREGGTLFISAPDARALEIRHMEPVILDRINTYFGHAAVKKLSFLPQGGGQGGGTKKRFRA